MLHGDSVLPVITSESGSRKTVAFSLDDLEVFTAPLLTGMFDSYVTSISHERLHDALHYSTYSKEWPIAMYVSAFFLSSLLFRSEKTGVPQQWRVSDATALLSRSARAGGWRGTSAQSAFCGWCEDRFPCMDKGVENALKLSRIEHFAATLPALCDVVTGGCSELAHSAPSDCGPLDREYILNDFLPNAYHVDKCQDRLSGVATAMDECVEHLNALAQCIRRMS